MKIIERFKAWLWRRSPEPLGGFLLSQKAHTCIYFRDCAINYGYGSHSKHCPADLMPSEYLEVVKNW